MAYLAQRKPIPKGDTEEKHPIEKTSAVEQPREPEMTPVAGAAGQSWGNPSVAERAAQLEAAIANVTRLMSRTDEPETAAELVGERRAMRAELDALQREAARNVVDIAGRTRRS